MTLVSLTKSSLMAESGEKYLTVDGRGTASFETQGSEFICNVNRVESTEEAEDFIRKITESYSDATHNVPAYRVRENPLREWSNDDGEPSGSAGKPVLNVLVQEEIENVVAVVTRYYGGTKLGYGGLVRAYSKAVKDAIKDAGTVETVPLTLLSLELGYDDIGSVKDVVESMKLEYDAEYTEKVSMELRVPEESVDEVTDRLMSATNGRINIE